MVSLASRGSFFPSPAAALFCFFSVTAAGESWLKARALPLLLVLAMSATALRVEDHVGGALGTDDGGTSEGAGCTEEKMEKTREEKTLSLFPLIAALNPNGWTSQRNTCSTSPAVSTLQGVGARIQELSS